MGMCDQAGTVDTYREHCISIGGPIMLIRHKNDPGIPSHHGDARVPGDTEKGIHTKRPVLVLQVGTDLDPGLRRKHDPNEDTLFVTHGTIPSVSSVPTPF